MTAVPSHAIIIPHYNDLARLERCLAALDPQITPDVEVVVADNASPSSPQPVIDQFGWARMATEPRPGAGHARNRGVAETSAPVLVFLDADCVPDPDWVQQVMALEQGDSLSGGDVQIFHETPAPRSGAEVFEEVFAFKQQDYIERKGFSITANLVTTRAVFTAVGPFRDDVSEDVEWCWRARDAGFALAYVPQMRVGHPSRSDWPALKRKWHRLTQEMGRLAVQSPGGRVREILKAAAMPLSALAHLPRIALFPGLTLGERMAGMKTLVRLRCGRMIWMLKQALKGPS